MAFCPACGEEAVDTFCEACLRDQQPLVDSVDPFTLIKCASCDRMKIRGQWTDLNAFDSLVEHNIKFNQRARVDEVEFPRPVVEKGVKEFELPLRITGTVSENIQPYVEEYEILVPVEQSQCERCAKGTGNYFEGTLQLRNARDEVIEYIEKQVQETPEVFIAKAQDVRGGIDFEITNQKWLHSFGHDLHKRFGGEIKTQSKLHGYDSQRSKMIFRLTVLIRLPNFWKGDVIEFGKHLMRIDRMGANLQGFELRRRKRTMASCPHDSETEIHGIGKAVLSSVQPQPMILDPETYQEVPLAHPVDAPAGIEVSVVQDSRSRWFIVDTLDSERKTDKR